MTLNLRISALSFSEKAKENYMKKTIERRLKINS